MNATTESLKLSTTKADPAQCQFIDGSTVLTAYTVADQYGRNFGWLLRAKHDTAGGAPEWYAVTPEFACSVYYLASRERAQEVLAVLRHAEFISSPSIARPMKKEG